MNKYASDPSLITRNLATIKSRRLTAHTGVFLRVGRCYTGELGGSLAEIINGDLSRSTILDVTAALMSGPCSLDLENKFYIVSDIRRIRAHTTFGFTGDNFAAHNFTV